MQHQFQSSKRPFYNINNPLNNTTVTKFIHRACFSLKVPIHIAFIASISMSSRHYKHFALFGYFSTAKKVRMLLAHGYTHRKACYSGYNLYFQKASNLNAKSAKQRICFILDAISYPLFVLLIFCLYDRYRVTQNSQRQYFHTKIYFKK